MKKMRAKIYPPVLPISALTKNWKLLLISAMFAVGLCTGALIVRSDSKGIADLISSLFNDYYKLRSGQTFWGILYLSFLSVIPYFIIAFIAGVSAVGVPVSILIPTFRGLGIGVISGYLYSNLGLKGVAFSALLIVPQSLISSVALILACRESLSFSAVFFTLLTPKGEPYNMSNDAKLYCMRFGFLLIIVLLSAFVDAVMSSAFLGLFPIK